MSALVWEGARGYAAPAPADGRPGHPGEGTGSRRRSGRPDLVLVPTGPAVPDAGGLRLTSRGRVVLAGVLLALAVAIGLAVSGPSAPAPVTHTVTVQPGQTLSGLAAAELPGLSLAEAMTAIRVANELTTTTITAGETLVIPQT